MVDAATLDFSDGPITKYSNLKKIKIEIFWFSNVGSSLLGHILQIFYEIFYVDLYDVGEVKIGMNVDHADVTNNLTRQS